MSPVELAIIDLPEFGVPTTQPTLSSDTYDKRVATARERAAAADLGVLIVYEDREHFR